MEIENVRGQLEECAGHYTEYRQMYTGPVAEGLKSGNEHLRNAAAAIGHAISEIELAIAGYNVAEAGAVYARTSARRAETIANSGITSQSADLFVANLLPPQSRNLAEFSQQIPSDLIQVHAHLNKGKGSAIDNLKRVRQKVEGCLGKAQTDYDLALENGNTVGEWADRIRSYLNRM